MRPPEFLTITARASEVIRGHCVVFCTLCPCSLTVDSTPSARCDVNRCACQTTRDVVPVESVSLEPFTLSVSQSHV
ncbi:hypothetical protein F2P81_023720 [Scophthalmus maximus]|uniref:Uncharacterized protein n=1 Tax=Scophthalmus maximus TaxID=52904 RepID=A0A6A4RUP0_SCOMX|nr:hypothetical protein F2P81_023720 [Scophthalmus maximus]